MFNHKFLTCSPSQPSVERVEKNESAPALQGLVGQRWYTWAWGCGSSWQLIIPACSSSGEADVGFLGTTLKELYPWDATCESCGKEMTYMNFVRKEGNWEREDSEEELGVSFPEYPPALLESWNCCSSSSFQCHPFCFWWRKQQMPQQSLPRSAFSASLWICR